MLIKNFEFLQKSNFNFLNGIINNDIITENNNNNINLNENISNKSNFVIQNNDYISSSFTSNFLNKKRKLIFEQMNDNFKFSNNEINLLSSLSQSIIENNINKDDEIRLDILSENFDHIKFKELQINNNTCRLQNIDECPICFIKSSQTKFLCFSISSCNHIISKICWIKLPEKKLESPICRQKIERYKLRKVVIN